MCFNVALYCVYPNHSQLRLLLDCANLELRPVLLEHALIVILQPTRQQEHSLGPQRSRNTHFPELLACILAAHSLENLRAAGVLVYEAIQLIYILVDDNVQPLVDRVVLGDLLRCELFGHAGRVRCARAWSRGRDECGFD